MPARTPPDVKRFLDRMGQFEHEYDEELPKKRFFKRIWDYLQIWAPKIEFATARLELTHTPRNYIKNGDFRLWSSSTVPMKWTLAGSPTISQVPKRPGSFQGSLACQIAAGGSAGSISQSVRLQQFRIHEMSFWIKLSASASATIYLTPAGGATNNAEAYVLTAASYGTDWFQVPGLKFDCVSIETNSDTTSVTVKFEAAANTTIAVSDIQYGPGIARNPDLFVNAPEDTDDLAGVTTFGGPWASPAQITVDKNDYAPGATSMYRITSDAVRTITGFSLTQSDGMHSWWRNVGSNGIILAHQNSNSAAANRLVTVSAQDIFLPPTAIAHFIYDTATARWVMED